ncbi:MAG: aminotransferase class I/II-fold pyridoxal phosphate-dependent enzyme [Anaerolineales bacterium]|nr:aminotransferase class I/II-fold pyridoxal phosphate-dependent enzyme [Anaerolineales bacterium]MDW8226486.1 aminotransferase class I/II-fold pyridoxal phosphate-dependent enzyme [Anaerolineales bacterium]
MSASPDLLRYFRLKPVQAARVSEVSEVTAAAPVPPEDRINFHIGHPLQDSRLTSAFLRIVLNLPPERADLSETDPSALLEALGWKEEDRPLLEFLVRVVQRSVPYMPRGGFLRQNPHPLVRAFLACMEEQQEGLRYDSGEQSGRREVILASGGVTETLRILWFALSTHLDHRPAHILVYRYPIPEPWRSIPHLVFEAVPPEASALLSAVERSLNDFPGTPTFVLLGDVLPEETRRTLRALAMRSPLYFLEANDAPNHHSLAREAGLEQRVLRLLTPGVFSPRLRALAVTFLVGNADILNVIENVHFNLKGTPSAPEVELLTFALEREKLQPESLDSPLPAPPPVFEPSGLSLVGEAALPSLVERAAERLEARLSAMAQTLDEVWSAWQARLARPWTRSLELARGDVWDDWTDLGFPALLDELLRHLSEPSWAQTLQERFLGAFLRHHPYYRFEMCRVVSGSSRTALGILGFHAGLREAVIPDLSWSYEQCFPVIHAVPLGEGLTLDAEAILARVQALIREDPTWSERGAVVLCNPHNATGRVFDETALRRLVGWCLENGVYVVDDLAYQNIVPQDALPHIKTLKEIALELVAQGRLRREHVARLVTVHSLSKIDCLAGARLAVVEIPEATLLERFEMVNALIRPNQLALLLAYLFYRAGPQAVQWYWRLRNRIFQERSQALLEALRNLPAERNPYAISILPPQGSMYPLLQIERLPRGVSLDWLATVLARRGVGLLPLASFARTERGFELGRSAFRLTLGGADSGETLVAKARRLLILMNRLVSEEEIRYNRAVHIFRPPASESVAVDLRRAWENLEEQIYLHAHRLSRAEARSWRHLWPQGVLPEREFEEYARQRLGGFRERLQERALLLTELKRRAVSDASWLQARLAREFYKDSLVQRRERFRERTHDRTVHPTQMYSLSFELAMREVQDTLLAHLSPSASLLEKAARQLWMEYLGATVSITSRQEGQEILLDMARLTEGEDYADLFGDAPFRPFLSFWSDWDGSSRPSGQGHLLAATIVMENVRRMSRILQRLHQTVPQAPIEPGLLEEIRKLPARNLEFNRLLDSITSLTHALEQRYRSILPLTVIPSNRRGRGLAFRARDEAERLLEHNDSAEQAMLKMRQERRRRLDEYFALNKRLRKQLYALIPTLCEHRSLEPLLEEALTFHDLLQRTVITPRIHQGMIVARDQFAIDTTVFNLHELNAIAGTYGNPGMALAVQISMASRSEAFLTLERKLRARQLQTQREYPQADLPTLWLVPLFEDEETVRNLPAYLDAVWQYAVQSREAHQSPQERFAEMLGEVFIAGSDLSQQVSQPRGAYLYLKAKQEVYTWLATHGVADAVRIKLGSGEAMQRQGGYYAPQSGQPAFLLSEENRRLLRRHLSSAASRSAEYAVTPLQGVFLYNDLRTLQSNISEQLRSLPLPEQLSLFYHLRERQTLHRRDLQRAAEMMAESRLTARRLGLQEMERLTIGWHDPLYEAFLERLTLDFRHILYGREEDVAGIHIISYFIGRSLPQLRDRPTSRRARSREGYEILSSIAEMIPLARQGSLLRAIAHNQAQTMILGVNQLTTGLFRALERYLQTFPEGERERILTERILPHLPVYEILHTLRLYQDWSGEYLARLEAAFPAGNSAFLALREDRDAMPVYLPFLQQELLRRHGVNVGHFFRDGVFLPSLLPALRPDLAVLLQANLANTETDAFLAGAEHPGHLSAEWREEVARLLRLPAQIRALRARIWEAIGDSVYRRVETFMELATALYEFAGQGGAGAPRLGRGEVRISPALSTFLRAGRMDDEMRDFLLDALGRLSALAGETLEAPVRVLRALNDVERLAQIEESGLSPSQRDVLRFCLLHMARLAGENG